MASHSNRQTPVRGSKPASGMAEYDIVVDIDSIVHGNRGWPVYISQNLRRRLQHELEKQMQVPEEENDIEYERRDEPYRNTYGNSNYDNILDDSQGSMSSHSSVGGEEPANMKQSEEERKPEPEPEPAIEEDAEALTDELLQLLDLNSTNTIVSVSGLFNRGKTFLLNKLAKTKLPSDFKVTTKGLSFILPQDDNVKNLIFLDTAGRNSPLSLNSNSVLDKVLAEKKTTELFMQDLIFDVSDVVIVVVNQLTFHDQEYLSVLRDKLKSSNKEFKKIYVVHNFHDVTTETDLLTMWRKYVLFAYEGAQKTVAVQLPQQSDGGTTEARYFVTKDGSMTHVFLANDFSPAGKYWNPRTFELLRTWLKGKHSSEDVPLQTLLLRTAEKHLRYYCKGITSATIKADMGREDLLALLKSQEHMQMLYSPPVVQKPEPQPEPSPRKERPQSVRRGRGKKNEVPPNPEPKPKPRPRFRPLDGETWDKRPEREDTEMVKMPPGVLRLVINGDMSLKRDKVTFNGYHITLEQSNTFKPKIDTLNTETGFVVLVDMPGFRPYEDDEAETPEEVDDVSTGGAVNVYIDRETRQLIIEGRRILSYPVITQIEGDFEFGEIESYEPKHDSERPTGAFERRVPLPADIELDSDPLFTLDEGQGVIFLKKAKKRKRVIPKRPTRRRRANK